MQKQQPATFQIQTCKIKIYFAFYWRVGGGGKIFSAKSLLMLPHPAKCKVNIKVQQSYSWTLSFLLMNGLNQKAIIQPLGGNSPGGCVSPHHNPTPLCFDLAFLRRFEGRVAVGVLYRFHFDHKCNRGRCWKLWREMQEVAATPNIFLLLHRSGWKHRWTVFMTELSKDQLFTLMIHGNPVGFNVLVRAPRWWPLRPAWLRPPHKGDWMNES